MGSWKIIEILLPLIFLIASSGSDNRLIQLFPSSENRISPFLYTAGGEGNNCSTDKEVTVFPDPDSPTIATVSPWPISNEIFFTAGVEPDCVLKSTLKSFMRRRG
jgi:hypothetical protein